MGNKKPLVTVIVPAYNHEKYVRLCIESILNQTYKNIELIVVDDGSKDNTPIIITNLQKLYGFKLFLQENMGLSATLTNVISNYSNGTYISICASDDYWPINKIEMQVAYMEEHTEYAMCFGKTYYIDENSELVSDYTNNFLAGGYLFEEIITQKFHPPVNYMYRKAILKEFKYFKAGVIAEDFYMNCLISKKYRIGFIDEFLSYYRVERLEKKRDPYKLFLDQRNTIDLFKNEEIYSKAVTFLNLHTFSTLSLYRKYKLLSLKYMILSSPLFYKRDFFVGLYRLLYYWIKI